MNKNSYNSLVGNMNEKGFGSLKIKDLDLLRMGGGRRGLCINYERTDAWTKLW